MTMKILKIPGGFSFHTNPDAPDDLWSRSFSAEIKLYSDHMDFFDYGLSIWARRSIMYQGKTYHFIFADPDNDEVDFASLKNGQCTVVEEFGKKLTLKPEVLDMYIFSFFCGQPERTKRGNIMVDTLYDYRGDETAFVIADLETEKIKARFDIYLYYSDLLHDNCITGFDKKTYQLVCLDYDLKTLWSFKPEEKIMPKYMVNTETCDHLIIQNFGPTSGSRSPEADINGIPQADKIHTHNDTLYALSLDNGQVVWKLNIPKCIDNMQIHNNCLYLCSANEIHQLNAMTGEIIQIIDTGLSDDYNRPLYKSSLHIQNEFLYFCHHADACLLIYNLADLSLFKRIDIPEPYTIKNFEYYHKASGKLYFELGDAGYKGDYYHTSPVLELLPEETDTEIIIDSGPEVDIQLKPAENKPDEQEIWITLKDCPIDKAMVYGEMHTQDQAYYHGHHHPASETLRFTPQFNGQVHFCYNGCPDCSEQEILEKMAILKQRFNDWADGEAFAGTEKYEPATLETHLIQ